MGFASALTSFGLPRKMFMESLISFNVGVDRACTACWSPLQVSVNYLRLDCFDTCNGDQQAVQARSTHETPNHLLSTLQRPRLPLLAASVVGAVDWIVLPPYPVAIGCRTAGTGGARGESLPSAPN